MRSSRPPPPTPAVLVEAGFPALMVENFGDAPFYPDVGAAGDGAAMTLAPPSPMSPRSGSALRCERPSQRRLRRPRRSPPPLAPPLSGSTSSPAHVHRSRRDHRTAAEVCRYQGTPSPPASRVWADVMVKHATAPPGLDAAQSAEDTVHGVSPTQSSSPVREPGPSPISMRHERSRTHPRYPGGGRIRRHRPETWSRFLEWPTLSSSARHIK